MAIDFEAIRKKIKELEGGGRSSRVQFWKPGIGKYEKMRALPWPEKYLKEGLPFVELWFYYIGDNRGILTPEQFGKEDPVAELRNKLFSTKDADDREFAKGLFPSMRCFLPVINKEKPEDGVMIWSFGKTVYQRLLSFFDSEDTMNWMDPEEGFDLEVKISKQEKKKYNDTTVDLARKNSAAAVDAAGREKLIEEIPDIYQVYAEKSTQEIEKILDEHLRGASLDDNDGTSRNDEGTNDVLDNLVDEVKDAQKSATDKKSSTKKTVKKKTDSDNATSTTDADLEALASDSSVEDLDEVFDKMMESSD